MKLHERTAIVTGAGAGIGEAIALRFAEEGAFVIVCDSNLESAQRVTSTIEDKGGKAQAIFIDVSSEESVVQFFSSLDQLNLPINILVNNAGIGTAAKCADTKLMDWHRTIAVNLTGTYLMCNQALPRMVAQKSGVIINMSSAAAMAAVSDRAAYIASKGGVLALTKSIALDYVKDGIRTNAICPGTVDTPWVNRITAGYEDPAAARIQMEGRQPMGRFGRPEEIAGAALYLASDDASFVTGTALIVDGGFTMR